MKLVNPKSKTIYSKTLMYNSQTDKKNQEQN